MNSVEIISGNNQTDVVSGQNTIDLPGGGLFRVVLTWYFLAPNFPVCVYEEVARE
jgi:hypothetical protein